MATMITNRKGLPAAFFLGLAGKALKISWHDYGSEVIRRREDYRLALCGQDMRFALETRPQTSANTTPLDCELKVEP